ncbi:hypothetical protein [Streptomyces sp. NPDC059861]|uniref:hypothetical protein n=1 Tax=Streptomyces sp. NPDC059861 TaxID=3346974 RepID=UPI003665CD67
MKQWREVTEFERYNRVKVPFLITGMAEWLDFRGSLIGLKHSGCTPGAVRFALFVPPREPTRLPD